MRLLPILLFLVVAFVVLLPLLRRIRLPAPSARRTLPDELVKDPVCQTYIVRSRAVTVTQAGHPLYFCSTRCAERFAVGSA